MALNIGELAKQNPWWANKKDIDNDRYIVKWENSSIKWMPRILYKIELNSDVVYSLRGPRQVGKTTSLKMLIRELLKDNDGIRIFYWTCLLISSPREFFGILNTYIDWARRTFPKERLYIFIDEISRIQNWQNAIIELEGMGKLKNVTVILTGSHTLDLRKTPEKLPGRRGNEVPGGPDKIFLPMKFVEYVETRSPRISRFLRDHFLLMWENRKRILLDMAAGNIPNEIELLRVYSDELKSLFQDYLITGGIALSTHEYITTGKIPESVYATYVDIITGDMVRWGKKDYYLKQLLGAIFETITTPVSWSGLWKKTDMGSHHTADEYVNILKDIFAVSYFYRLDKSSEKARYGDNKKIYLQDPFIFHALRGWVLGKNQFNEALDFISNEENRSKLVECVVSDHLIRLSFNFHPKYNFDYMNFVFYWRGKRDREVDFVLKIDGEYLPIEVKYANQIKKNDIYGLFDFIKTGKSYNGIVISKDDMETKPNYMTIPAHIFLLLV